MDGARDGRAPDAERQHVDVGVEHAVVRDDAGHAVAVGAQGADGRREPDADAEALAPLAEPPREDLRVAGAVGGAVDGTRDLFLDRGEHGVDGDDLGRVEDAALLAVVGEELHLRRAELELPRVAVEVEDPGVGVEVVDLLVVGARAWPCTRGGSGAPSRRAADPDGAVPGSPSASRAASGRASPARGVRPTRTSDPARSVLRCRPSRRCRARPRPRPARPRPRRGRGSRPW